MAKKQIITNAEIEKDIADALKNPPRESEASYKKFNIPAIIIAIVGVVIGLIFPTYILWFLLALIAFSIIYCVFYFFRLKNRIKNVTINDYAITTETVNSIDEEHYRARGAGKHARSKRIDNYIIRFENGKAWRIPKELYRWSDDLRMSDFSIHGSTHRGDVFKVVTKKDTCDIAVAYNTNIFEYKN